MEAGHYRDLVAAYLAKNYGPAGLEVFTEVFLGTTIIGKKRQADIFLLRRADQRALVIECKYQGGAGTTDEKIPYALQDLEALWVPGCLVYAGDGWSSGVLHMLKAAHRAARCFPGVDLVRSRDTWELDHIVAAVFGLWDSALPEARRFDLGNWTAPAIEGARIGPKPARARGGVEVAPPKKASSDE